MPTVSYNTINGQIRSECIETQRRSEYLADALGSVVFVDSTSYSRATYLYSPFGTITSSTALWPKQPAVGWVGGLGYHSSGPKLSSTNVRARHYATETSQWTTRDPLWPQQHAYRYAHNSPTGATDPSGLTPVFFQACAFIPARHAFDCEKPFARIPTAFGVFGLNTQGREIGDEPLKCKLFFEAKMDSCQVGRGELIWNTNVGKSVVATFIPLCHPVPIYTHRGWSDAKPIASGNTSCSTFLDISVRAWAAVPIVNILPIPIKLDILVFFTATRTGLTVSYQVKRTAYPDFEFRIGTPPTGNYKVGDKTAYIDPLIGLLNDGVSFGSHTLNVPTGCCGGGGCK